VKALTVQALTVRQPWAFAICCLGKGVENRTWRPAPDNRGPLLIHAAKGCTRSEYDEAVAWMVSRGLASRELIPDLSLLPRGAIVARSELVDAAYTDGRGHRLAGQYPNPRRPLEKPCKLCGMMPRDPARALLCPKADPWAIPGQLGLVLADVASLAKPIAWKGTLGFFDVPADVLIGGLS
jgi:hypothetical protein